MNGNQILACFYDSMIFRLDFGTVLTVWYFFKDFLVYIYTHNCISIHTTVYLYTQHATNERKLNFTSITNIVRNISYT